MAVTILAAITLALTGATPLEARDPAVPSVRDVREIESGLALLDDLRTVGVVDSASLNRNARVSIRRLRCAPMGEGRAECSYEASRCLAGEADPDGDGWCARTTRFVRGERDDTTPGISRRGWRAER